jgi:AAA domain/Primase C terminal 2 (PriCT-2)
MSTIKFSLGRNTFDNQPAQCIAADFDDFVTQIRQTGSTRKGETYICGPLAKGVHTDPVKNPGVGHWRTRNLALPRRYLPLDADEFSSAPMFVDFQKEVSQWNSVVYTTASHTDQAPRARAIIELSRDVDYAEGIALGDALQRMLEANIGVSKITLDPSVYRAAQPVYTPLVGAQITRYVGPALDVDAVLLAWPAPANSPSLLGLGIGVNSTPPSVLSPMMLALIAPPETPTEITKVQTALANVSADCPYPMWITILFALRSTGWACAESMARQWSMTAPHRYNQSVFDKVWKHAKPIGGISIGTLYHHANQSSASSLSAGSRSALTASPATTAFSGKLCIPSVPPPPRDYVLGKVLVAGTVGVMAGVGAAAKTTAAIQFAINGALGKDLGPFAIGDFASALFLAEESTAERDRRFGALCSKLTSNERTQVEKLVYCEAAAGHDLRLTMLDNGNANETQQVERIIQTVLKHQQECSKRVGLIVIDHARLVMAGDPIASDHVTALLRALTWIATQTGAAVLLLAHSPKSTYGKDGDADPSEVFGSGAFVDHTRAAIVLHTMREKEGRHFGLSDAERKEHVCMHVVKANYGPTGGSWWFKKEVIPNWSAVELVPVLLLPKGQANTQSTLARKITDIVRATPGQLSSRALRDRYSGSNGKLGASERYVRDALERLLNDGLLILRPPTKSEREKHRLSANTREVLDLPGLRD